MWELDQEWAGVSFVCLKCLFSGAAGTSKSLLQFPMTTTQLNTHSAIQAYNAVVHGPGKGGMGYWYESGTISN